MAKKISQLTAAGALSGTEEVPIVQGGQTVKTTVQDIANKATGGSQTLDQVLATGATLTTDRDIIVGTNTLQITASDGVTHYSQQIINDGEASLVHSNFANTQQAIIQAADDTIKVSNTFTGARGIEGQQNYSANIQANDFTQKNYVDTKSPKVIQVACSDETTALTTGTKATFRMPYGMTVSAVRASLTTAQASGSIFTVDIKEGGTTILSTLITIDNTEKTSTTAAAAPVISDTALADDAEITILITQIGASGATGLKVSIIGT